MDKTSIIPFIVAVLIALTVGTIVMDQAGELGPQRDAMEERAQDVYENYTMGTSNQGNAVLLGVPLPDNPDRYNDSELVRKQMYVTGNLYKPYQLADDLPMKTYEVTYQLHRLAEQGVVDRGYAPGPGVALFPTQYWVHTAHDDLPNHWWSPYASALPMVGIVILLTILIGVIGRIRSDGDE